MRARLSAALLWAAVVLAVLTFVALALGRGSPDGAILVIAGAGFAWVGRMLTRARPDNAVSWTLALIGVVLAAMAVTEGYVKGAPASDPRLAIESAHLLDSLFWNTWLLALVGIALPLLFPDGRLPSRRWRWVAWAAAAGTLLVTVAEALTPGPIDVDGGSRAESPLAIAGAGDLLSAMDALGQVLSAVGFLGAAAAVIVRLRRSRGVERQQLKWFAYVVALGVAGLMLAIVSTTFAPAAAAAQVLGPVGWFTGLIMLAFGIPIATGIAVLRHGLYDIDVVINRTLVYGALTATLAGTYLGSVLLLQLVLSGLTAGSGLAVAGSTLAVAGLFRPARSRIQAVVDRRFFRRKYDAARTLDAFGVRLRDEVDLDALKGELRAVVADTMQPAHVSLWLREEPV